MNEANEGMFVKDDLLPAECSIGALFDGRSPGGLEGRLEGKINFGVAQRATTHLLERSLAEFTVKWRCQYCAVR